MYDIITTTPDDKTVMNAVNSIIKGGGVIPSPGGNYVFSTPNASQQEGNGGTGGHTLVIVGHGSAGSLSGCKDWSTYKSEFSGRDISWNSKTTVYIVACSTAAEGGSDYFNYQNFASTVKKDFPNATVWASKGNVGSISKNGDWEKITA